MQKVVILRTSRFSQSPVQIHSLGFDERFYHIFKLFYFFNVLKLLTF